MRLSERKNAIAKNKANNIPFDQILKEVIDSRTQYVLEMLYSVEKTDLWNIEMQLKKV